METDIIKSIKDLYEKNDLNNCRNRLVDLMLLHNSNIKDGKQYKHDFKHALLKSNIILNPLGKNYSVEDYNKTIFLIRSLFVLADTINKDKEKVKFAFQESLTVDIKIKQDLLDLWYYTEYLYNTNKINTKRLKNSSVEQTPIVEQIFELLLFNQDQTRLLKKQYPKYIDTDFITGLELSVANNPVEYSNGVLCSMAENNESLLESINQLIKYLYFKSGEKLKDRIKISDIDFNAIKPYGNQRFKDNIYIARQRSFLQKIEEGMRYGYYGNIKFIRDSGGEDYWNISVENDNKLKARRLGILRRDYQFQKEVLWVSNVQGIAADIYDELSSLSKELINCQEDGFILLDLHNFVPDVQAFKNVEEIFKINEYATISLTKDYYLDCIVKEVKIRDLLCTYSYLYTLSEIVYQSSMEIINEYNPTTYVKELCIVDISYLEKELSRIYGFDEKYTHKLIDRFIFHENKNSDDIFAQPLIKISKTQILLSQSLLERMNLDRVIECQFTHHSVNIAKIGTHFEKEFIDTLSKGYKTSISDLEYKKIPNFEINKNEVKYTAFDGKEIQFDVIAVLGDYLILTELKAMMTSYDLASLESKEKHVREAIEQLHRRAESLKYDWKKFRDLVSIKLPEQPLDSEHIILIACTDAYDFTPLKEGNIFITDSSSYLKYFTNPYFEIIERKNNELNIFCIDYLWKKGYPNAKEFMDYLVRPATIELFWENVEKHVVPMPYIDEEDVLAVYEDYKLMEDPIKSINTQNH